MIVAILASILGVGEEVRKEKRGMEGGDTNTKLDYTGNLMCSEKI